MNSRAEEFARDWRDYSLGLGDMSQEELVQKYKLELLPGDSLLAALFEKYAEKSR